MRLLSSLRARELSIALVGGTYFSREKLLQILEKGKKSGADENCQSNRQRYLNPIEQSTGSFIFSKFLLLHSWSNFYRLERKLSHGMCSR